MDVVDKDIKKREQERNTQKAIMDAEQSENFEEDFLVLEVFDLSSINTPSGLAGIGSTTSEPVKNSILSKKISNPISEEVDSALKKDKSFRQNISIREDMFCSVQKPLIDSVFPASSRNNEDLSYMSKSVGIASEGAVSHSASAVVNFKLKLIGHGAQEKTCLLVLKYSLGRVEFE